MVVVDETYPLFPNVFIIQRDGSDSDRMSGSKASWVTIWLVDRHRVWMARCEAFESGDI